MFCKLCDRDVQIQLYSDDANFEITDDRCKELLEYVDHMHWCHNHRLCAICGQVVQGEDLDLILEKEVNFQVNPKYEAWRKYPDHGLLTTHKECMEKNG